MEHCLKRPAYLLKRQQSWYAADNFGGIYPGTQLYRQEKRELFARLIRAESWLMRKKVIGKTAETEYFVGNFGGHGIHSAPAMG